MSLSDLDRLKHYMEPYYQEDSDEDLLSAYLEDYTYPECAAEKLWFELEGKAGLGLQGLTKMDTGSEAFTYSEPGTMQLACQKAAEYYREQCFIKKRVGSAAIKVAKTPIGGVGGTS